MTPNDWIATGIVVFCIIGQLLILSSLRRSILEQVGREHRNIYWYLRVLERRIAELEREADDGMD